MGLYTPQNETITIFEKAIKWVNKHRNVNENSLREIVYIHELAHWISHKLPHPNSPEWRLRDYIITDTFVHESWAQLLTYWGVKYISLKYKNKNLEEIFLKFWSPLTSIDEKDIQKLKNRWFALYRFYGRINEIKPDRKTEVFESLIELRKIKNGAHIEEWINFLI
ncbi:MAG: hypothetical protein ACD_79C00315G0001 [uncultured bacterium]|nr:MAG: hypothetical protein ACD_79C00315G0001 [uncultured bacterium]